MELKESILKLYEQEDTAVTSGHDLLFKTAVVVSFLTFGLGGYYLHTHNPPPQVMEERMARARQVSFLLEEPKKPKPAVEAPKAEKKAAPKPEVKKIEPIDLTNKPQLAAKVDDVKPENPPTNEPPVRRVYGLRKVYATGIGAGGTASEAVIGKLGNTLATPIDTLAPTKEQLKGPLVPITTITTPPRLIKSEKPEYTKEMIEAKVEGTIKAELLINAEGAVVEAKILNDLGFSTRERAREAFLKWRFEPSKKGNEPVAVWITFSIRFVLLDE